MWRSKIIDVLGLWIYGWISKTFLFSRLSLLTVDTDQVFWIISFRIMTWVECYTIPWVKFPSFSGAGLPLWYLFIVISLLNGLIFLRRKKSTTNPVDYRVLFHLHFLDLPSQIPYHLILDPKEGRGLEISDFELQGFGLLFLYKMPGFPKHQSALLEAHVPSRKNSIPTVNLANR